MVKNTVARSRPGKCVLAAYRPVVRDIRNVVGEVATSDCVTP